MRKLVSLVTGFILVAAFFISPLAVQPAQASALTAVDDPNAVVAYAHVLHKINPHLPGWQSRELASHLLTTAGRWHVDANVLVALVTVESAWRTHARSRVGALGLGQLMPGTAARLGVNPRDPYQNLSGAARYLGGLLARYAGHRRQYELAFAAYNAGPKAVERFGGIPPYAETQNYVVKVMRAWKRITSVIRIPAEVIAQTAPAPDAAAELLAPADDVHSWSANGPQP